MLSAAISLVSALVSSSPVSVTVSGAPLAVTQPTYASWNIDSSCNRGFHHTHFNNPNLRAAARGLAPSRLRFGGSGNDALVYGLSPGSPECAGIVAKDCAYVTPGCLNASHWDSLHGFAEASGAEFLFGVSFGLAQACIEGTSYDWNASDAGRGNAAVLLDYLGTHKQQLWGFELGNEGDTSCPCACACPCP